MPSDLQETVTNETERPELPALSAETSSSSSAVTDEQPSYQMTSPYNPDVYKCTGYRGEPYEYFDGTPGEGKDQRFTIDIEHGTMDRLRDVRPHLYYVGYWSETSGTGQAEFEKGEAIDVENRYVNKGREHLMKERSNENG